MTVADLAAALDAIAPTAAAEDWDNVGLLVGDPASTVTRAVLCIDYTAEVAAEGEAEGCDAVVAYHPPIFKPLASLTADGPGRLMLDAARRGVAVYSPHTALDVAAGGTNDGLADALYLTERRPLRPMPADGGGPALYRLVAFVPTDAADAVSDAVFDAGAGAMATYDRCGFRTPGTGTFRPLPGANPAVGQVGRLETVAEERFETLVPAGRVAAVVAALRAAHPYEVPAFDLIPLAPDPGPKRVADGATGLGRVGDFAEPVERDVLFARLKRELGVEHLLIAGPADGTVARAAVCAGSCGDLLDDAIAAGATLYVTGELRHHDALKAADAGVTVVMLRHSVSERHALTRLAARLTAALPGLSCHLARSDRDPFDVR